MPIKISLAGDGTLAPDVEGVASAFTCPACADDHPKLLLHGRIGGRCLHATVFEGRPLVLVEIGQDRGGLDGGGREAQWRLRAHGARCCGDRGAVWSDGRAGDPVIRAHAVDIMLHDLDTGYLPRLNRRVQLLDRRLFQTKRLRLCAELCCHAVALYVGSR